MPGVDQDYKERAVPKLTGELPAERFDTIMSVRLQIATAAMQGMLANSSGPDLDVDFITDYSLKYSDALIRKVAKQNSDAAYIEYLAKYRI